MPENKLTVLLISLGFTEKEAMVYVAIQKQGRVAPADLAGLTNINRTTVYSVVKELIKKEVIIEDLGTPSRELIAAPPDQLSRIIEHERQALEQKQTVVNEAVKHIQFIAGESSYPVPKIQFVKEDRIEAFLYERTSVWDESIVNGDGQYLGFQEEAFVAKFAAWIDWYWKRAPEQIHLRLLSNESQAEKHVASLGHARREIVFWKEDLRFTATTWVMGDYVVMFVLSSSPNYLVEIHDARFADNQRALFQAILEDIDKAKIK